MNPSEFVCSSVVNNADRQENSIPEWGNGNNLLTLTSTYLICYLGKRVKLLKKVIKYFFLYCL